MNTTEFSEAIAKYSLEETVKSIVSVMQTRRKGELPEEAMLRSHFESMDVAGREFTEQLVRYAVASSFFHLLVVIDNCDAIEEGEDKGEFSLHYSKGGQTRRLGEPPDYLHDALPDFAELVKLRR